MSEEETIVEFNVRVLDIANESDVLGEKMFDAKFVRKVLRSLPPTFNIKITAIEESKRKTCIALTSMKEEVMAEPKVSSNEESLAKSTVLLTKQVAKLKKEKITNGGENDYGSSKFERNSKVIRCHECEGFGHFQTECPTYLKRKKKSLVVVLSDDEDSLESDEEEVGRALISISITTNKREVESADDQVLD
ncbi:gag-pol polyprotein [Cucumis melo var. makuwa]|uniref:Gag-pol polyprotein n=1 Tax=Cucumis melo var. makuwa TaxID=1194695 RepID=A0A5D3C8K0_CUCMM|nr:gag-pol polyprotein [Cucumis melo var. makuwa]TYK07670.1 gag-pol polyprotein [Cucumis melo var. makuwa]